MKHVLIAVTIALPTLVSANPVQDAMQDYAEFATYDAGIILPEQITQDIFANVSFIDTRSAAEFTNATIPGASHIEWRDIFSRTDEFSNDRKVILFCNTGALSAQAAFGLRVLGFENVVVLQTGFDGWQKNAAYKPAQ